jgi:hypothetical protein
MFLGIAIMFLQKLSGMKIVLRLLSAAKPYLGLNLVPKLSLRYLKMSLNSIMEAV